MKKVLGFIGAAVYSAIIALVLNQLFFWVTPWFMGQKAWFLVFFWICLTTPLCYLLFIFATFVVGTPINHITKGTKSRILPTIIFAVIGVLACMLPWALEMDYKSTLTICFAVSGTICIAATFISAIVSIWVMKQDKK